MDQAQTPCRVDRIFIDDIFTSMGDIREIITILSNAGEFDEIQIHLSSLGGDVATVDMLCYFIRECKAEVVVHLYGLVASAATFIPLAADRVVVHPTAKMLLHSIQSDDIAMDSDTQEWLKAYNAIILKSIYSKFLTPQELDIISRSNMVISNSDLIARFKGLKLC